MGRLAFESAASIARSVQESASESAAGSGPLQHRDEGRMKIAIMMRAIDQDTAYRVYIECLVEKLIEIAPDNDYLLLYRSDKWFGRFAGSPGVEELLIGPRHKLFWDQWAVPWAAWKHGADVIYNPKFSVPLVSHCPVAVGLQEPAWWATPEHHPWWDVLYMKTFLHLYCRRASHFFPWTHFQLEESRKYLGLPFDNASVTYAAPNPVFRRIEERARLEDCRERYSLPERFILAVTRVENIGNDQTTFSATKNPETTVRAYRSCEQQIDHELVIAGRRVREYFRSTGWSDEELEGIHFLDFVPQEDLALVYNLADLFVIPSFYEGFALTIAEAMSCGCPVLVSSTGACSETAEGAALLADPRDPADFAAQMVRILEDSARMEEMSAASLRRAAFFDWEKTARTVLEGLRSAVEPRRSG